MIFFRFKMPAVATYSHGVVNILHQSSTSFVRRVLVSGLLSSRKSRALVSQAWVARVFPRLVLVAYFPAHCLVAYFPALGLAPVYMLLPPILIGALGICVHDWSIIYSVLVRNLSILKKHGTEQKNYILQSNIHHV